MFEKQIESGIRWMDHYFPDWLGIVNVDGLQMNDVTKCVVGQVLKDYFDADFWSLELSSFCVENDLPILSRKETVDLGFATDGDYPILTSEWISAIESLKSE